MERLVPTVTRKATKPPPARQDAQSKGMSQLQSHSYHVAANIADMDMVKLYSGVIGYSLLAMARNTHNGH